MGYRRKAPAYQWFPGDYLSDVAVMAMTAAEEGTYRRLLDISWLDNGLPADKVVLCSLTKCTRIKFDKIWEKLAPHFYEKNGRLFNRRLEHQRREQRKYNRQRQLAAAERWMHAQSTRSANSMHAASSSSSSSVRTHVRTARAREKGHHGHAHCGKRFCVPHWLHEEFDKALGPERSEAFDLLTWYLTLDRALLESGEPFEAIADLRRRFRQEAGLVRERPATADEQTWAEGYLRRMLGQCPHTPKCADRGDCVWNLVLNKRARDVG